MTAETKKKSPQFHKNLSLWLFIIIAAVLFSNYLGARSEVESIPYSQFREKLEAGRLADVKVGEEKITGSYTDLDGSSVLFETGVMYDPDLVKDMQANGITYEGDTAKNWVQMAIFNFGPFLLFILLWIFIMRRMNSGGKQAMSFGRSRAKMHVKGLGPNITFNDVAGLDEAKEEMMEIVEFLKNPKKFTRLGGVIPKGVLLYGPPGTGKTLLAKAIAGEADVPFFSTSGSEFVEMFVGVGASRIRDLFANGRRNAPCIIFIDELDAVGRSRFSGLGGGHDEREQTLNQILTELDGFDGREGVILVGATNRPDVLDPALLRKGRFDRHINVARPNRKERQEIFELHAKKITILDKLDFDVLARRTPGFAGSDIANVMNESALLAGREDAKGVTMHHAEEAIDRIIAGPAKKSRVISDEEKRKIAYHEAGHTLVALHLKNADPVHKVSILQRGPALGYTLQLPMEDRYLTSEDEILDKLSVMLGGRSAEEIIFNEKTTGAHDDLRRVTEMAYKLVVEYGMSEELGPLTYNRDRENIFLGREISQGREYSEETARRIDKGVRNIVERCHKVALDVLETNKDKLIELAEELIKREQIVGDEIKIIAGIMPPPEKTELAPEVESESKETRDSEPDLFDIEETSEADEASLGEKDKLKQEKDAGDDKTLTSAKTSPKQERDAGDDKDLASVKTSSKQERDAGDNKALSSAKASSKQEKDSGDDRSLAVEENSSKKEKTAKNDKSTVRGKAVPKKEKNVGDGDSAILKKDISKAEKDSGNDESLAGLEKTPKKGEKASSDKSSPKSSSSKNPSLEKENLVEAEEDKKGKDGS